MPTSHNAIATLSTEATALITPLQCVQRQKMAAKVSDARSLLQLCSVSVGCFPVSKAPMIVIAEVLHSCIGWHSCMLCIATVSIFVLISVLVLISISIACGHNLIERRGSFTELLSCKRPQQAGLPYVHDHDVRHAAFKYAGLHSCSQCDSLGVEGSISQKSMAPVLNSAT